MLNSVTRKLSGTHITLIALGAMFAPSLVYAVAPTDVVLQDPAVPARQAHVDAAGRLTVYDVDADYAATPSNYVAFYAHQIGGSCDGTYTVPAGKALILSSASAFLENHTYTNAGSQDYISFYYGPSGNPCRTYVGGVVGTAYSELVTQQFGSGLAIPAGSVIGTLGSNDDGPGAMMYGYLVPANTVP